MKKKHLYIFGILTLFGLGACTDLTETMFSDVSEKQFATQLQQSQVQTTTNMPYAILRARSGHEGSQWILNTITSDEGASDWGGSEWETTVQHNLDPYHGQVIKAWNHAYSMIAPCNGAITFLDSISDGSLLYERSISEIKLLMAWHYYTLMDLFGRPVWITDANDAKGIQLNSTEMFNKIEKEILDNVDNLYEFPTDSIYGKVTKSMAYTLMAKMYLNGGKYTGTVNYPKVIEYCDKVINMQRFELEKKYMSNFVVHNENSKENIFVVPFSNAYDKYEAPIYSINTIFMVTLTSNIAKEVYGLGANCWSGFTSRKSFIDSFEPNDSRIGGWIFGQPKGTNIVISTKTPDWKNHGDTIMGARFCKYEYQPGLTGWGDNMDNDWVLLRYADVLLMKAEALMRQNGGGSTQVALNLVNQVRARAGLSNFKMEDLNLSKLLTERGHEFYWESYGFRRQDQIRFGTYLKPFDSKPKQDEEYMSVFPIPGGAIDANSSIVQNPGY
ncbi:MAG: RagB/SusD family nutrient uptake outer membrane protein [Mariniphaga sp.]|nr:RagB/SusD family nutrient uptake outer membrane protein [Mariniphaga sp.]